MLPVITLDDERFEEIVERARKMIPGLYPEWTDYNYHDPGITMLELLAWLKETQQFHMDQIGEYHIQQYIRLLGERQRETAPAKAMVSVSCPKQLGTVLKGSRFWASEIPFETCDSRYLENALPGRFLVTEPGQEKKDGSVYQPGTGSQHIRMFGGKAENGTSFWIGFSSGLKRGEEHRLYFRLFHGYRIPRNPIPAHRTADGPCPFSFVPLASVTAEYFCEGEFRPVEWYRDGTYQFLEDGFFCFQLEKDMEPDEDGWYWMRFTLSEAAYDVPPVLEEVSLHELEVRQIRTVSQCHRIQWNAGERPVFEVDTDLAEHGGFDCFLETEMGWRRFDGAIKRFVQNDRPCFELTDLETGNKGRGLLLCFEEEMEDERLLGAGDGFPGQEISIGIPGLCAEGLEILVETGEETGLFEPWNQVEDLNGCGPSDACYTYEEAEGILKFGNCKRGRAPMGRILLAAGHTSLGAGGNVKTGTIQESRAHMEFHQVWNRDGAYGGRNHESLSECQARILKKLKQTERAVTYEDYERLVRKTPGLMIEKVRAIPVTQRARQDGTVDETKVTLVVKPYSSEAMPRLGRPYLQNIRNMLEPRRLIGTKVSILSPEYIGITIFAEIETDSHTQKVKQEIRDVLCDYFEHQGSDFGQPVLYGTIYGIMDVLEHVRKVKSISLDAQGSGIRRSRNGDIILPVNGQAYLKEWDCMISAAD